MELPSESHAPLNGDTVDLLEFASKVRSDIEIARAQEACSAWKFSKKNPKP